MPVNFPTVTPSDLYPIAGLTLGIAKAQIKKPDRKDLLVMHIESEHATVAGVFTQNRFCAAPVQLCLQHLQKAHRAQNPTQQNMQQDFKQQNPIRALVINTGYANAGTGLLGLQNAHAVCAALAKHLGCAATQILPFSTGVILEPLPVAKIEAGLPQALADLKNDHWYDAAQAIMTTDTLPKAVSRRVKIGAHQVTLTGISKGAGMIKPNMATMLGFIATDAKVRPAVLNHLIKIVADQSFNCVTVDGDTSTNDSFVVIATGAGECHIDTTESAAYQAFEAALLQVAQQLAQMIVRDGEGATKFVTIHVQEAQSVAEAKQVAYAIAHSPLVKTAFFACDPNLGRILAAIGYADIPDLEPARLQLWLNEVRVIENGERAASYQERDGQQVMREAEITIRVQLARGAQQAKVWTCDLSHDYVSINADYRS